MKKTLVVLLLAAPVAASAAIYEGLGGGRFVRSQPAAALWGPAIGQTLRLPSLYQSHSLSYLAKPLTSSTLLVEAHPQYAARLASVLTAAGWTPEKFAAMPEEVRRNALRDADLVAAEQVRSELKTIDGIVPLSNLDQSRLETSDTDERVVDAGRRAAKLLAHDLAYVGDWHQVLDVAAKRGQAVERARQEKIEAFSRRLPAMIANDEITGKNLLFSDGRKWGLADEGPFPTYDTVDEAVAARAAQIASAPIGPWSEDLYNSLRVATRQGLIKEAARDPEALEETVRKTGEAISLFSMARTKRYFGAYHLKAAIDEGTAPSARLIAEAEKSYLEALNDRQNTPVTRQAIFKTMRDGAPLYFPTWAQFQKAKAAARARLERATNLSFPITVTASVAAVVGQIWRLMATRVTDAVSFFGFFWPFLLLLAVGLAAIIATSFFGSRQALLRDVTLEQRMADYERSIGKTQFR